MITDAAKLDYEATEILRCAVHGWPSLAQERIHDFTGCSQSAASNLVPKWGATVNDVKKMLQATRCKVIQAAKIEEVKP